MIRFNRNGSVNWLHKARKSALSHPYAFDVDQPDGGLLVGFARTPESNDDGYAATVQISSGIGWRKIPQETRNGHDGTTDRQGGLFVTGATEDGQSVNGQPNAGKNDVYVIKYRRQ